MVKESIFLTLFNLGRIREYHIYVNNSQGVLTLTWYTYMCLPFGVIFREIWYSNQWVFITDERAQMHKLGVF